MADYAQKIEKLAEKKKAEKIVKYLDSKDKQCRLAAIRGLGEAGGDHAFNHVVPLLHESDSEERIAATDALVRMSTDKGAKERATTYIRHYLQTEPDETVQKAMRTALDMLN